MEMEKSSLHKNKKEKHLETDNKWLGLSRRKEAQIKKQQLALENIQNKNKYDFVEKQILTSRIPDLEEKYQDQIIDKSTAKAPKCQFKSHYNMNELQSFDFSRILGNDIDLSVLSHHLLDINEINEDEDEIWQIQKLMIELRNYI